MEDLQPTDIKSEVEDPLYYESADDNDDDYVNETYGSEESESDVEEVRSNRKRKEWIFVKKFPNALKAETFVKNEETWSANHMHATQEGKKQYYRCNKVKKKGPQCSAAVYLLYDFESDNVLLYRTKDDHTHDGLTNRSTSMPIARHIKQEIERILSSNPRLKPRFIVKCLRKNGFKLPAQSQLNAYLYQRRKRKLETSEDFEFKFINLEVHCLPGVGGKIKVVNVDSDFIECPVKEYVEENAVKSMNPTNEDLLADNIINEIPVTDQYNKEKVNETMNDNPSNEELLSQLLKSSEVSANEQDQDSTLFPNTSKMSNEKGSSKGRGPNKSYEYVKTFPNLREAESHVHSEGTWSLNAIHKNKDGSIKRYYRCNKVKKKGPQCSAQVYLHCEDENDKTFLYKAISDHDHHLLNKCTISNHGLSEATKAAIKELLALRLKPQSIMHAIRKMKGVQMPTRNQLNNFLFAYRRGKYQSKKKSDRRHGRHTKNSDENSCDKNDSGQEKEKEK